MHQPRMAARTDTMTMDVLHTELVGGGPGLVVLRVSGRAFEPVPCHLAPPALLIADAGQWRRLATVAGTPPIAAGPEGVPFAVDVEVPLHLATAEGPWWLEPGLPLAGPGGPGPGPGAGADPAAVDALRVRIAALAAELAALRARVEADASAPSTSAIALPRPRLRALRPTVPVLLFAAGALAVGDAVATVAWQEPISALWASRQQHVLEDDLAQVDASLASQAQRAAGGAPVAALPNPKARMRTLARTLERVAKPGKPVGRLTISRIDASFVVVQGTGASSLRRGPGHYPGTPLPGQPGTVGVAGHRTTYGAPFRHLDQLKPGDTIDFTVPYGRFRYRVEGLRVVTPDDVSSLRDIGRPRLVLTACHPLYSAAKRLLVIARLDSATPRGAAAAPAPPASSTPSAPAQTPAPARIAPTPSAGDAAAAPQRRA